MLSVLQPIGIITSTLLCFGLQGSGVRASAAGLVSVKPQYQEVPAGGEVLILYRTTDGQPITECSFRVDTTIPTVNDTITWTLAANKTLWTPTSAKSKTIFQGRYFGKGLLGGECGVALSNVTRLHLIGARVVQGLTANVDFATVYGYKQPTVQLELRPRVQTVAPGSDVNITCVLEGGGPIDKCSFRLVTGSWVNFNLGHDSKSTGQYHYEGRGLKRGHCGIRLLNVTAENSGWYICSVSQGAMKIGHRISVVVVSGGKPSVEVTVNRTVFEVGESLVATCQVRGPHPLPETVWRLGNKILPEDDSHLSESRNAWLWEEQSWTLELDTTVGIQFNDLPLRCELLKDVGCETRDVNASDVKMIQVRPNCGVRIEVQYDSSAKCKSHDELLKAAEFIDDTIDQPTDPAKNKVIKKKFEGFPWHAGIYQLDSKNSQPSSDGKIHRLFKQICGGTLITKRHVVTAAHCFGDKAHRSLYHNALFKVALGKYYRDYGQFDCRVQWREVNMKQVHVHSRYVGTLQKHKFDIAVIDLGMPVMLTTRVGLACVDWDVQYSSDLLARGNSGWLSGWGYLSRDGEQSEVLRTLALPYMDVDTCLEHLNVEMRPRLTSDKFCAGFRRHNISACPGDSGGGLLFNHTKLGVYYVSGIASTAFRPFHYRGKCYMDEVTTFTNVTEFVPWLKTTVNWADSEEFHNLFYKHKPIRSDWKGRKVPRIVPKIYVVERP